MTRRLSPVGLDFAESAPLRMVFAAELSAPPEAVYAALADDVCAWSAWFTGVSRITPVDGGKGRVVRLTGGTRFRESIMAAEAAEHYAYRVDETNAPGLRALLEDWRLTPGTGGTLVRWTFAADGPAAFRTVMQLARPMLGRAFRDSMRRLDRRLVTV
ncbi:MxaD family protein [Streptomyces sp. Ru73]|uniref:SRPBCC family protein n=1 Tax=Streptomyces sp. Ru73 TaxID=2080748 RepID=UPI000CDD8FF3|nr:SRPBCC family protein [Streptomyces sp. Ru73]POX37844.1 MxaD family protein [Streptomyces sp. Ru73]